jgi:hypothetical protein
LTAGAQRLVRLSAAKSRKGATTRHAVCLSLIQPEPAMPKASITDEVIKSQKVLETAIEAATKRQAQLTAAYKQAGTGFSDAGPRFVNALSKMKEAGETLERGLWEIEESIKFAKTLLNHYDMIKRKAREAEDFVEDQQEQADKAEKAAKAAKGDKDAQKKSELAAKALDKAKAAAERVNIELTGIERVCKKPLNDFESASREEWIETLKTYAGAMRALRGMDIDVYLSVFRSVQALNL